MKPSKLKCLVCERVPAVQHYAGLVPVAVLCAACGRTHRLTPVVHAESRPVQATAARA